MVPGLLGGKNYRVAVPGVSCGHHQADVMGSSPQMAQDKMQLSGTRRGRGRTREGMILGAQGPRDRLVGQCRTEVKSTRFGIKLVWRPTPSMSVRRSLHQPESLFHTREVGQEQDLTSSGCRRD